MYTADLVYIWFLTNRTQHRTQDRRIKSIKINTGFFSFGNHLIFILHSKNVKVRMA
jgi:hypothetical protein